MNTIKYTLLFLSAVLFHTAFAGDPDYAVNRIAPELLKNANAVKRFEESRFEVINIGKARLYHRVAITVLNEKGDDFVTLHEGYDKLHSIESIEGRLFDESGKKIRTLKKSEVQDLSGTSDISLAEDNRIKLFSFYHKLYPYTVEYETEVKFNYTLFYPRWQPQEDEFLSVEYSKMSVTCPADIDFRFKSFNLNTQPTVVPGKGDKTTTWEVRNLAAIEDEYASPDWNELSPVVWLGPVQFQVENYQGNMSTWQDFGKFVYALKAGRDELPDNIKATVHSLTDNLQGIQKKTEVLYHFMQQNTRYISIQLGIGGWQPFDAKYVAANRYGDCKALSNYMFSLLKEAGIKSYYTLIRANNRFFISDFPSSQFNHAILCVPVQKDTIWLECTSQTASPGYMSSMTCDRNALLIDESGGTLVRTPRYGPDQNLQVRNTKGVIDEEGNLVADINTSYGAVQQDRLHGLINGLSKEKVMEYLKGEIDLPTYDVLKFEYKQEKKNVPVIIENLTVTANNYSQVTGSRLFVVPNILSRWDDKLTANDNRKYDVVLITPWKDVDTVEIRIPAGYSPEAIPAPVKLETKFGSYSCSVKVDGDRIVYYRSMEKFNGRFPPSAYSDLVKFYDQLYKYDRNKVVLVKR